MIFNKTDIFTQKIKHSQVKDHFPVSLLSASLVVGFIVSVYRIMREEMTLEQDNATFGVGSKHL